MRDVLVGDVELDHRPVAAARAEPPAQVVQEPADRAGLAVHGEIAHPVERLLQVRAVVVLHAGQQPRVLVDVLPERDARHGHIRRLARLHPHAIGRFRPAAHLVAKQRYGARPLDVGDVEAGALAQGHARLDHAGHQHVDVFLVEPVMRQVLAPRLAHLRYAPPPQISHQVVALLHIPPPS